MAERLLTAADAARRLGVSAAELDGLVKSGALKAFRIGGELLRFHPDDLEAFRSRRSIPAKSSRRRSEAAGPISWLDRLRDFLYAYDFYLLALGMVGMIVAMIFVMQR